MTSRRGWTLLAGAGALAMFTAPILGWRAGHLVEASRGLPQTSAFLVTGGLAVRTRPEHRGAQRLLLVGLVMAAGFASGSAYSAYLQDRSTVPTWGWAAVLALQGLELAQGAALLALLAVFPDGRYHRGYERGIVLAGLAFIAAVLVAERLGSVQVTYPGNFVWGQQVSAPNQGAQLGLLPLGAVGRAGYQVGFLLLLACGVAMLGLRFRHFEALERRQTAWPLLGVLFTVVWGLLLGTVSDSTSTLPGAVLYLLYAPAALAVPVSILIGMLRHRLLDIDVVIRRSVVYSVLWLLISLAYVAVTLSFGVAVGGRVPLALAVALTIAATLGVAPARRRLERLADRLVFGRRVSGYELIAQLGARLESTPNAEDLANSLAADVRAGLRARWVRVVLDADGRPVIGSAGDPPPEAAPTLSVPLATESLAVGAIECGPRREGRYSEADLHLLESLGRQAALAVHNSWLTVQLADRLAELTASRARIVQAEDASRRRLERDIHDGVQQELVAVLARLGLARNQLRRDPHLAELSLAEVTSDAQRALVSLQDLARGIHPPLLTDRGVVEAVRARAAHLTLRVEVRESGLNGSTRLAPDVEGAAYFVVIEALGNVLKHAHATRAWVDFSHDCGALRVQVRDNGSGFDVDAAPRHGLMGLRDRVEALGGTMTVTSAHRAGTTVTASIPAGEPSHV
ncbi:signal transduction histidine kinase [Phycicoccus badiiscoriae]|uniref:histidine kinase n=1 Tax=Pedococcus badiiscoriae TaxID=642776 RepID=A0A852WPD8_9MICO|nr:ATP-binding protein [Pedococcus badiiscoriae]NYG07112.1 signal transduction histidine kinase [Pedococcus badiiscoriae]